MAQERKTDAAFAPRAAHTQRTDPAHIRIIIGMRAAQVNARNLITVHGEKPKRRVKAFIIYHEMLETFKAFLEGWLYKAEMVAERFGIGAVNSLDICFRVEGAERNPSRKFRFGQDRKSVV